MASAAKRMGIGGRPIAFMISFLVGAILLSVAEGQSYSNLLAGRTYQIRLFGSRRKGCRKDISMAFTNQSCSSSSPGDLNRNHGPILREPIGKGRRLWEEWVLDDLKSGVGGSYLATIRTKANTETIRCIGNLEPEIADACDSKLLHAHQVTLREYTAASSKSLWRIVPVPKTPGVYNIVLNSRRNGCLRFLGASPSCGVDEVSLFGADDGSDLQQWKITPVYNPANVFPSPSPPVSRMSPPPPQKVTNVPKVAFTLAFPQVDVDSFLEDDKQMICQNLMQATKYPKNLLSCNIDKVQTVSEVNLRKRKLQSNVPAAIDSGVVVSGGMTFNVGSSSQSGQALVAAQSFENTIQNPSFLSQTLGEEVTGSSVVLVSSATQLVPSTPTPSSSTPNSPSPTPSPSPTSTASPFVSPAPIVSSPSPTVSPATSPSNPIVPVPVPVPVPTISPSPPPPSPPSPLPAPSPPTAVQAGTVTATSWSTSWTASTGGAQSYKIQCLPAGTGTCGSGGIFGSAVVSSATSGSLSGASGTLAAVTSYDCYVVAYADNGGSGSVYTCSSPSTSVQTLPQAPSAVQASTVTATSWSTSWTASTGGAQSYKLNCVVSGGACGATGGSYGAAVNSAATSGSVSGSITLVAGTTYSCYSVAYSASDGGGSSSCSLTPIPVVVPLAAASPPTAVQAGTVTATSWSTSWTASTDGAQSYRIQCLPSGTGTCGSGGIFGSAVVSSATSGSLSGASGTLAAVTSYDCYVVAYADNGGSGSVYTCSSPSTSVQTLPQAPSAVQAGTVTATSWSTSWTASTGGAQSYRIQCLPAGTGTCGSGGIFGSAVVSSATSGSLSGASGTLAAVTSYDCYVVAYADNGGSGAFACSPSTSITTVPLAVSAITYVDSDFVGGLIRVQLKFRTTSGGKSYRLACNDSISAKPCVVGAAIQITGPIVNQATENFQITATVDVDSNNSFYCSVFAYSGADGTGASSCGPAAGYMYSP